MYEYTSYIVFIFKNEKAKEQEQIKKAYSENRNINVSNFKITFEEFATFQRNVAVFVGFFVSRI